MADWSQLNHNMLVEIASRVRSWDDLRAIGGVCTTWRAAAVSKYPKMPLLMTTTTRKRNDLWVLYSFTKHIGHQCYSRETVHSKIFSSRGWLITIAPDLRMSLLHPFSCHDIKLPHISTLNCDHELDEMDEPYANFVSKVVLSSSPDNTTADWIVMIIYGFQGNLAFCKSGDEAWTTIQGIRGCRDVIYHKEKFHAVNYWGQIVVCDVRGKDPTMAQVCYDGSPTYVHVDQLYLVESAGDLLVISRYVDVEYDNPWKEEAECIYYQTLSFQVFKVDLSTYKWEIMKSLGSRAVFLGFNSSFSIDASTSQCQPNSIYFTDDCVNYYWSKPGGGGKDMGTYFVRNESIGKPFFAEGDPYNRINPPIWVEQIS